MTAASEQSQAAYCSGRKALADELQAEFPGDPHLLEVLRRCLWSPAWCGPDGVPEAFFPSVKWRQRFEVIGFEVPPLGVETVAGGRYLRLQTTSNWVIPLDAYPDPEAYFRALSRKSQKKLRWLLNVYEREQVQFVPVTTREHLEEFMSVYAAQWPGTDWGRELKETLFGVYLSLIRRGASRSYLVRDATGQTAAACLGYVTGQAYNLHMLTRREGVLEKFSPGYYLAFWLVRRFLAEERLAAFFFGPGEFGYKKSFLAKDLPVFRYECRSWTNLPGVIRLYHRARKERRRRAAQAAEAED